MRNAFYNWNRIGSSIVDVLWTTQTYMHTYTRHLNYCGRLVQTQHKSAARDWVFPIKLCTLTAFFSSVSPFISFCHVVCSIQPSNGKPIKLPPDTDWMCFPSLLEQRAKYVWESFFTQRMGSWTCAYYRFECIPSNVLSMHWNVFGVMHENTQVILSYEKCSDARSLWRLTKNFDLITVHGGDQKNAT